METVRLEANGLEKIYLGTLRIPACVLNILHLVKHKLPEQRKYKKQSSTHASINQSLSD